MRLFSDKEQELVNTFLKYKEEGDILNLQVARFIRKELDCFAIRYQDGDDPQIRFYSKDRDQSEINKVNHNYITICDFIYFLQELESNGFIKFQRSVSGLVKQSEKEYILLFDRDKYQYNEDADNFTPKDINPEDNQIKIGDKVWVLTSYRVIEHIDKVYLDFVKDLIIYGNAIIYPLPLLKDFAVHNFKDLQRIELEEARRSNRESKVNTLKSIKQTRCSIVISAIAVAISFVAIIAPILFEVFWSNSPSSEDMANIKSAIESNQRVNVDSFVVDTINVRITDKTVNPLPITLKVNVSPNQ